MTLEMYGIKASENKNVDNKKLVNETEYKEKVEVKPSLEDNGEQENNKEKIEAIVAELKEKVDSIKNEINRARDFYSKYNDEDIKNNRDAGEGKLSSLYQILARDMEALRRCVDSKDLPDDKLAKVRKIRESINSVSNSVERIVFVQYNQKPEEEKETDRIKKFKEIRSNQSIIDEICKGNFDNVPDLTQLNSEAAEYLVIHYNEPILNLNNLYNISEDVLEVLAKFKGKIKLEGLDSQNISEQTIEILAKIRDKIVINKSFLDEIYLKHGYSEEEKDEIFKEWAIQEDEKFTKSKVGSEVPESELEIEKEFTKLLNKYNQLVKIINGLPEADRKEDKEILENASSIAEAFDKSLDNNEKDNQSQLFQQFKDNLLKLENLYKDAQEKDGSKEPELDIEKLHEQAAEIVLKDGGVRIYTSVIPSLSEKGSAGFQNLETNINDGRQPAKAIYNLQCQLFTQDDFKQYGSGIVSIGEALDKYGLKEIIDIRHDVTEEYEEVTIPYKKGRKGFFGLGKTPNRLAHIEKRETGKKRLMNHNEIVEGGKNEPAMRFTYLVLSNRQNKWRDYSGRYGQMLSAEIVLPESSAKEIEKILERDPAAMRAIVEQVMKEKILKDKPEEWKKPQGSGDSLCPPYEKWDAEAEGGGKIYIQKEGTECGFHEDRVHKVKKIYDKQEEQKVKTEIPDGTAGKVEKEDKINIKDFEVSDGLKKQAAEPIEQAISESEDSALAIDTLYGVVDRSWRKFESQIDNFEPAQLDKLGDLIIKAIGLKGEFEKIYLDDGNPRFNKLVEKKLELGRIVKKIYESIKNDSKIEDVAIEAAKELLDGLKVEEHPLKRVVPELVSGPITVAPQTKEQQQVISGKGTIGQVVKKEVKSLSEITPKTKKPFATKLLNILKPSEKAEVAPETESVSKTEDILKLKESLLAGEVYTVFISTLKELHEAKSITKKKRLNNKGYADDQMRQFESGKISFAEFSNRLDNKIKAFQPQIDENEMIKDVFEERQREIRRKIKLEAEEAVKELLENLKINAPAPEEKKSALELVE